MTADLNEQIRELIDRGADPVSFAEITARPAAAGPGPATAPGRHRRHWAAVAVAGIAAAIAVAWPGGPAAPERSGQAGTVLTAAMVRQFAAASGTALTHTGHMRITYSDTSSLDPGDHGAGTDDITFSGRDWNDVTDQSAPPNGSSVNRFAGGRLYYYGPGFVQHPGDPLRWLRETNPAEIRAVTSVSAPDPRQLLRVLDPAARFVRVGYQVIGGVRVEQLRATRLGHLPGLGALPGEAAPIGRVTSLNVWVDSHGVIRQLHLTSRKPVTTGSRQKFFVIKNGHMTVKLGPSGPGRHGFERASAWVSFLDIGQPETITAPAHAVPVFGRG